MNELLDEFRHQGPFALFAAMLIVALVRLWKDRERLQERLEAREREWQAQYNTLYERHVVKAENWAEKGFAQGEKLTQVLDRLAQRSKR